MFDVFPDDDLFGTGIEEEEDASPFGKGLFASPKKGLFDDDEDEEVSNCLFFKSSILSLMQE